MLSKNRYFILKFCRLHTQHAQFKDQATVTIDHNVQQQLIRIIRLLHGAFVQYPTMPLFPMLQSEKLALGLNKVAVHKVVHSSGSMEIDSQKTVFHQHHHRQVRIQFN